MRTNGGGRQDRSAAAVELEMATRVAEVRVAVAEVTVGERRSRSNGTVAVVVAERVTALVATLAAVAAVVTVAVVVAVAVAPAAVAAVTGESDAHSARKAAVHRPPRPTTVHAQRGARPNSPPCRGPPPSPWTASMRRRRPHAVNPPSLPHPPSATPYLPPP